MFVTFIDFFSNLCNFCSFCLVLLICLHISTYFHLFLNISTYFYLFLLISTYLFTCLNLLLLIFYLFLLISPYLYLLIFHLNSYIFIKYYSEFFEHLSDICNIFYQILNLIYFTFLTSSSISVYTTYQPHHDLLFFLSFLILISYFLTHFTTLHIIYQ